jgi:hypothetical protein
VLALGLVEHREAAVEPQLEHFVYLGAAQALEALVGAIHISEVAESASFLDNVHKDPFVVVDLDRADASGAASHEVVREVVHPDVDDIFAGADAWADGVLEYVVVGEVDRAWDVHALADAHTSGVAGDDVEAVATTHLYHQDHQDDAYDADQAVTMEVVGPNLDHDDSQASFHLVAQLHCFHYLAAILFLFRADQAEFVHHSAASVQSLVDNRFLSSFDYFHFANALVLSLMVELVMPLFYRIRS